MATAVDIKAMISPGSGTEENRNGRDAEWKRQGSGCRLPHLRLWRSSFMPTYEYTCKSCGDTIEVFQKFSDKPLKKHAACGGELKKVFHARGVVFKGSGFYATDSRGTSSAAAKSDGSGPNGKSSTETKSTKKPDSKPKSESSARSD